MEELSRKSFDPNQNEFWQGYHFDYDAWGNTTEIQVWKPTSGTAATPTGDTASLATYQYNVNGTLARMNYPSGQYVTYEYDLLDRLVKEVYYNSNDTIQVEYQYIYSSDGQLAKQQAIRNGSVVESYRFEYDSLGRLIRSREGGDNNPVQRTEHLYDGANRLTAQNWSIGETGFGETYEYRSSDGLMTKMTAGTGFSLNYAYDALKRSSGVTIKKANGSELFTRSYSYWDYAGDNTRTTSRLKTYENTDANGNLMTGYRYTYDVNGNITTIEEAYTANSYRDLAVYAYDDLNQLDSETRYSYTDASATPATTTVVDYSIDTAGNLRSVSGGAHSISYTYSDSSWADLLTGITVDGTSRTISYSSAGNPDNWYNGTDYTNLVWEQGRRLSSVTKHMTDGTRTYDYAYDMSGVRSSKTIEIVVDGVLRHRRYDYVTQNGKVVRETAYYTDGAGEFMHCMDFFYDEKGNPFAMRKYSDETLSNFNNYYYVLNAQGDVVKLIAPSGSVYAEYTYDAWGNILDSSGSLRNTNPLRYRGYYYDKETGFYYLQSRYYDPIVKRFLNADSCASTGQGFIGYNMFAYCGNNIILYNDISGCYKVAIIGDDTTSRHNGWGLDFAGCIDYYIDCYGYNNVDVVPFQTAKEFVEGWNSLDNEYDELIIFAHGSKYRSVLWFQTNNEYLCIDSNNGEHTFSELKQIQVHSHVKMNVCYAAKKINDTSTAEVFANKTNCKVYASTSIVTTFWIFGLSISKGWRYVYPTRNANAFTPHRGGSSSILAEVMNCLY